MTSSDIADAVFRQADTNRDGVIDRNELRNFVAGSTSFDSTTGRYDAGESTAGRWDQYNAYDLISGGRYYNSERVVHTNSKSETDHYLATSAGEICNDPNPRIINRTDCSSPLTYEQRVSVRYLRPPTPPPPEPLTIREIREPQPPPPPPLVICERPPSLPSLPPLVLREQPPPLPPRIPGQTETRIIPGPPAPRRSVIIDRYPAAPPKPRDIVIERWLPYGPPPPRRTIVIPAPEVVTRGCSNTIVMHDNIDSRVVRKFENLGVTREDPTTYVSRYGGTILDSTTLVHEARTAGVVEDISTTSISTTVNTYIGGTYNDTYGCGFDNSAGGTYGCGFDHSGGTIRRTFSSDGVRETTYGCYSGGTSNATGTFTVTSRPPSN